MAKRVNIFNSHRWTQDDEESEKLRKWARSSDEYYDFYFYDVSKKDLEEGKGIEGYLKRKIRQRIDLSNFVLVFNNLTSSYNTNSIHAYEINYAKEKNKPILLVYKWGKDKTPSSVKDYQFLYESNWNWNSIRENIKKIL